MARTAVVRFTHSNGNTDFYQDEIRKLVVRNKQAVDRYKNINNHWLQYYIGAEYKIIRMTLHLSGHEVDGRLDEIYDLVNTYGHPEIMRVYYEYYLVPATNVWCQMMRNNRLKNYIMGSSEVTDLQLIFVEVQKPRQPVPKLRPIGA